MRAGEFCENTGRLSLKYLEQDLLILDNKVKKTLNIQLSTLNVQVDCN